MEEANQQESVQQETPVQVPKVDIGEGNSFSREEVEKIVNQALEREILGLKNNNMNLREEKKRAQERAKDYQELVTTLGGEEGLQQLLNLKTKIDQDEELRLFTTGDREKYNDRILSRARQDHANQLKNLQKERDEWMSAAQTAQTKYQAREVEKSILDGCADSGVNPRLYRAMSAQIRDDVFYDEETGKVLVKDGEGIRYGKDGQPMQVQELIDTMREEQPELFLQSTGAGAPGSRMARRPSGYTQEEIRNMPVSEYKKLREQGVIR